MLIFQVIGASFFGSVVGWITYFIIRRAQPKTIVDLGSVVGVLAGGVILRAFNSAGSSFAGYGIGLSIGFFAFYITYRATIGEDAFRKSLLADETSHPLQVMARMPVATTPATNEEITSDVAIATSANGSVLSVSDWIAFLSSEKQGTMGTVLNFGGVLVALVAILLTTQANTTIEHIIDGAVAIGFTIYSIIRIFGPFGKQNKRAQDVLNRILKGDLRTGNEIQKAWIETTQTLNIND